LLRNQESIFREQFSSRFAVRTTDKQQLSLSEREETFRHLFVVPLTFRLIDEVRTVTRIDGAYQGRLT